MTTNERIQNGIIAHAVDFQGYTNAQVRRMIGLLNRVDADLTQRLRDAIDAGAGNAARLDSLLGSVRELNRQAYATVGRELTQETFALTQAEVEFLQDLIEKSLPAVAVPQVAFATVSAQQVHAAAMARPFQGRLLSEWMQSLEAGRAARVRDTIRMGLVSGDTTEQIVRRIRGTRARRYTDGILDTDRRHLRTIVRTALSHTANYSRDRFHEANADIIGSIKWVSTLDSRTTVEYCVPRDGKLYTVDHKPKGHKFKWGAGPGAIHFGCRSTSVPVLKDADALGLEDVGNTRASVNGEVPADRSFGDWLKDQPRDKVEDILGVERAKVYFDNGRSIDRFYNREGRLKSLDDLRRAA